jgi:dihydrofolate reductase
MAELFLQISVSLDGYIEDPRKDIGWMVDDVSFDEMATATLRSIDGMIFGRRAHELLARFWPGAAESKDATPALIEQARFMNALPKYVLTHGEERTGWAHSSAIRLEDVPRLKREAARPLALFAGAQAAQAALAGGLLDEIRLVVYPIVLGGGTPLFAAGTPRHQLSLDDVQRFESGATFHRFRFR